MRLLGARIALLLFTSLGVVPSSFADDAALIRAVLERYRTSWLANDPAGVQSCFTEDAVLMPHHGVDPIVGRKAINDFWFASSSVKTIVLKFERTIDEIGGDGSVSFVRGHSEVAWRIEDKGASEEWRTRGSYLAILKKRPGKGWLITHLIWDDIPNERTK